jgi:hypothetical protein
MSQGSFLLPEVLDAVFEYLEKSDIHTCLFVNRQFHATAIPSIYRDISLYPVLGREFAKEAKLYQQLTRSPHLIFHVRTLSINISGGLPHQMLMSTLRFRSRLRALISHLSLIIEHSRALRRVTLISMTWVQTSEQLDLVLDVVQKCKSKPEITFDLCSRTRVFIPSGPTDNDIKKYGQKIFEINDKLPVIGVHLHGLWSPWRLRRLSSLHQLQELSLHEGRERGFEEALDFDTIFKDTPNLMKFTVSSVAKITSFPRNLRDLQSVRGFNDKANLDLVTWKAICNLQNLDSLDLYLENFAGQPIQFKSTKLRNLCTTFELRGEDTPIIANRILTPIYIGCPLLSFVSIKLLKIPFSLDHFRGLSKANSTLSQLEVSSDTAGPYTFRQLEDLAKNLTNLERLTLPWPTMKDSSVVGEGGVTERLTYDDVIWDRLAFEELANLARLCLRLKELEFTFETHTQSKYHYLRWSDFDLKSIAPFDMYAPLNGYRSGELENLLNLQSFSMAKLISQSSRCLNFCSLFYPSCEYFNRAAGDGGQQQRNVLYIPLNLVRNYMDHG